MLGIARDQRERMSSRAIRHGYGGRQTGIGSQLGLGRQVMLTLRSLDFHFFYTISHLGFDWKGLKQNAIIVDVGGGIGSQSMTLAQNHSHLRFVIQDRDSVVEDAVVVSHFTVYVCMEHSVFIHQYLMISSGMVISPAPSNQAESFSKVLS